MPDPITISDLPVVGTIKNNARNLSIYCASSATDKIVVDFDNLILRDSNGYEILIARTTSASALTIDGDTSGALGLDTGSMAITWYYIYVIFSKDTLTLSALVSTQYEDSPTLPYGYTFYRRVGAAYNQALGSAMFKPFKQFEDYVYYTSGSTSIASSLTEDSWTSITITNYVPRTAKTIRVLIEGNAIDSYGIAPKYQSVMGTTYGYGGKYFKEGGESSGTSFSYDIFGSKLNHITMECPLIFESTTIYYFVNHSSGTDGSIYVLGYIDGIDLYY